MNHDLLRIHHFEPLSSVNGPGKRAVLWLQGCSLGCPGCFNPSTHPFNGGEVWSIGNIYQKIKQEEGKVEGITISGGEPLEQRTSLVRLLKKIAVETDLSTILLTGYNWQEVQKMAEYPELSRCVDVIIAGPYRDDQRTAHHLAGSANKTIHFQTAAYTLKDFETIPECEAVINPDGDIFISGINPIKW